MKQKVIVRNVIQCKRCGKICESTNVHEFAKCDCETDWVAADGGYEYLRRIGDPKNWIDLSIVEERDIPICEECRYYYEDQDIYYIGECGLMKCSQYGESRACQYFREGEDSNGDN